MNVTVIGSGHVGLVTGACFAEVGHQVLCVDHDTEKIAALRSGRVPFLEPGLEPLVTRNMAAKRLRFSTEVSEGVLHGEIILITVHTPPKPDGSSNMQFIEIVARQVAGALGPRYTLIADKSTVPVQTGEKVAQTLRQYARPDAVFDVVSNPEFMREGSAISDQMNPDRIVVGLPAAGDRPLQKLRELYAHWITRGIPFLVTDIKSAELIKHAANSFLALKISYANALAILCEASGADVTQVADGMGLDQRIGRAFLNAGIGYGGSCFPKDVAGFLHIAQELGYNFTLLKEVQQINDQSLARFLKKIREALQPLDRKIIGLLGLAFKPNTDDIRNAPALALAADLQTEGARLRVYDPQAMPNARAILQNAIFCRDAYDAAEGADALILTTEWDEFRHLDLGKLRAKLRQPFVFDGRNLFDPVAMKAAGFLYQSVGR